MSEIGGIFNGNPMLTANKICCEQVDSQRMTLAGTASKTILLVSLVLCSASYTWHEFYHAVGDFDFRTLQRVPVEPGSKKTHLMVKKVDTETGEVRYEDVPNFDLNRVYALMCIGALGAFVVGLVNIRKIEWAGYLSPLYALLEGLAIGGISASCEIQSQGIVIQAVLLTVGVFFVMLLAYILGAVRSTPNLVLFVTSVLGAITLLYFADIFAVAYFDYRIGLIHSNGWLGIGFSLFACVMAAICFIIDFDEIEQAVDQGAPKYMEWYCGFGLLITLLWLYLEILRLALKLRSKDRD